MRIASGTAPLFLFIGGMLFQQLSLIGVGIIFFSAAVAFQLITLPVEFSLAGSSLLRFPFVNVRIFSQPTTPFQKEKNS